MVEPDETPGVVLGRQGEFLALARVGLRDDAYPEGAFGAVLRVDGGDVQLRRRCNIQHVRIFCEALEAIYRNLDGEAVLPTFDDVSIVLRGNGRGGIQIEVSAGDVSPTTYRLKVQFYVDQSYLPPFIRGLRDAFPSKVTS